MSCFILDGTTDLLQSLALISVV